MATSIESLTIELRATSDKFEASMKSVESRLSSFEAQAKKTDANISRIGSGFTRLQASITTVSAAFIALQGATQAAFRFMQGTIGLIQQVTAASAEAQAVEAKRTAALRNAGQLTADYTTELDRQADAFQKLTTADDDAIVSIQAQLVAFGASQQQMERLTAATLDLAAGMGKDLPAAALLVSKAVAGQEQALSKLGIRVSKTASDGEQLEQVLAGIAAKFGGQAQAAAQTYAGSVTQLSNAWGNLQEEIGNALIQNDDMVGSISSLKGQIESLTQFIADNREEIQRWITQGLQKVIEILPRIASAVGTVGAEILRFGLFLENLSRGDILGALSAELSRQEKVLPGFQAGIDGATAKLTEFANQFRANHEAQARFNQDINQSIETLKKFPKDISLVKNIEVALSTAAEAGRRLDPTMRDLLQKAGVELPAAFKEIRVTGGNAFKPPTEGADKAAKAAEAAAKKIADVNNAAQEQTGIFKAQAAILQQVLEGTLSHAEAERQIAILTEKSRGVTTKNAAALIDAQQAHKKVADAIEDEAAALKERTDALQERLAQQLAITQSIDDEIRLNDRLTEIYEQVTDEALSYAEAQRQIAIETTKSQLASQGFAGDIDKMAKALVNSRAAFEKAREGAEQYQDALKDALVTTNDLKDVGADFLNDLFEGDLSTRAFKDKGKEIGKELIHGIFFGKSQEEHQIIGNFNDLVGVDKGGGLIGGIFKQGGFFAGQMFTDSFMQGTDIGTTGALQSTLADNAIGDVTEWKVIGEGSGKSYAGGLMAGIAGTLAGMSLGGSVNKLLGLDSKESKIGSKVGGTLGGIGGGIAGFMIGGPLGAGIGSAIGSFLGSITGGLFGSLFTHIKTKGSQIRGAVKDFLKDIEVSFAKEIDSSDYFFKETKKLADKMFGGDFLAASKQILNEKAGPDLAAQLQALGTALTADQAIKLKKSVEQTGTTFGNMLLDNLGLDAIPDAIAEIVQKADLSIESLTDKLTMVFEKGKISAEFYKTSISGAVAIFSQDLPDAIKVSEYALASFNEAGIFDLEEFQKKAELASAQYQGVGQAAGDAFIDGLENGLKGPSVAANFQALLRDLIRDITITDFITRIVAPIIDTALEQLDLSKPLDLASPIIKQMAEDLGIAYDNLVLILQAADLLPDKFEEATDSADGLVDKITELDQKIAAIAQRRLELRFQGMDQLAQIGAISSRQAIEFRATGTLAELGSIGSKGPIAGLDVADLERGVELIGNLRGQIVQGYETVKAEIAETHQATVQSIQNRYALEREGIQEMINSLQEERQQTQELFQERLDDLRTQLQIAEDFGQAVESIKGVIDQIVGQAGFAKTEQQAFLQRQAGDLRAQIAGASLADRPDLIRELAGNRQSFLQASPFQASSNDFLEQRAEVVHELEALKAEASAQADKAAQIQQDILTTELAMNAALVSIDAQIASQQDRMELLSVLERNEIAAAGARAAQQLQLARETATRDLLTAIHYEELFNQALQAKLEEQRGVLLDQLNVLVGVEQATALLANRDVAVIVTMTHLNATLQHLDVTLANFAAQPIPIRFAAAGANTMTHSPTLWMTSEHNQPEHVRITPGGQPGSGVQVSMTFAPQFPVTLSGRATPQDAADFVRHMEPQLNEWLSRRGGRQIAEKIAVEVAKAKR